MTAFYDRLAATASRLLAKFGQDVVLSVPTAGTFDPITGTESGDSSTDYTVKGVLLNYSLFGSGDSKAPAEDVRESDRYLIVEAFAVEPDVTTSVNVDGFDWTVMNVKTLSPAGTAVIHEIRLRR